MVKTAAEFGWDGPVARWRALRARIHTDVCRQGFNPEVGAFVQSYGSRTMDASLLLLPLVAFCLQAIRASARRSAPSSETLVDGFVLRYRTEETQDGLPPGEGAFLPCSFWLADNWMQQGRREEAQALFERLLGLRNDVGLLAEEYDPRAKRQLGNFPQAFSHLALIGTALNLSPAKAKPLAQRSSGRCAP